MRTLNLEGNAIQSLPNRAFSGFENALYILLTENSISTIEEGDNSQIYSIF